MRALKSAEARKKCFMITIGLLLAYAVIGQIGIDKICLDSERGQYWEYESCLPGLGTTIAITGAAIGLFSLTTRFFPVKKKLLKTAAWVLGICLSGWMLFCSGLSIYRTTDSGDVYGAAGLWVGYVDRLEEEKAVWSKSHWFGHGDAVYEASFDEFTEAQTHLYLGNESEEPYHSIVDEYYKIEYVFRYCASDTMVNVLSYFFGRWTWMLYSLLVLCSVALGASMLPSSGRLPGKLLFFSAWLLFGTVTLLPALNGCGLVFDAAAGPVFTGTDGYYWQYGASFVGPSIGTMLGLATRKVEMPPSAPGSEPLRSSNIEVNFP